MKPEDHCLITIFDDQNVKGRILTKQIQSGYSQPQYQVRFIMNGDIKVDWFFEDELRLSNG